MVPFWGNILRFLLRKQVITKTQPNPAGPSTQYLRFLVPKTILLVVFGTRNLKYWVLGPSGKQESPGSNHALHEFQDERVLAYWVLSTLSA